MNKKISTSSVKAEGNIVRKTCVITYTCIGETPRVEEHEESTNKQINKLKSN